MDKNIWKNKKISGIIISLSVLLVILIIVLVVSCVFKKEKKEKDSPRKNVSARQEEAEERVHVCVDAVNKVYVSSGALRLGEAAEVTEEGVETPQPTVEIAKENVEEGTEQTPSPLNHLL